MLTGIRHTVVLTLGFLLIALMMACGDGPSESDIDASVEVSFQAVAKATALSIPTVTPVPAVALINTAISKPVPPTFTPAEDEIDEGVTCSLNNGEVVQKGWSGKDTGANYCNQCMCLSVGLACTKMACTSMKVPVTSTPMPTTGAPAALPTVTSTSVPPTSTTTQLPSTPTPILTATSIPLKQTKETSVLAFQVKISEVTNDLPDYDRDDWKHWIDEDRDCQNTRHEVLITESSKVVTFKSDKQCQVATGKWLAPYTGAVITDATQLDVDHMVPLKNAHVSGGWAWDKEKKAAFANDMRYADHLIAVTASANRKKGAKGPEGWKPSNQDYWCDYAIDWVQIKIDWDLRATKTETTALEEMLKTCDTPPSPALRLVS